MHRLIASAALIAAAALPLGASAASFSWDDVSRQTALNALDTAPLVQVEPTIAVMRTGMRPDVSTTYYLINFVTVGPSQSGTPCFNCVKGAGSTFNYGITGAYNYIQSSEQAQYSISFTDLSNTANCTLSMAITNGATTIDKFSYVLKAPASMSSYIVGFNRTRPKYSGLAVLTGKIDCAAKGAQTTTAQLSFQ